jgi:hypothetical protein
MASYIDEKYRVDIYLDTNILIDYIEGTYPALKYSIEYLVQTGYVSFHTSQYVLYEFAEVRKYNLFYSTLTLRDDHKNKNRASLKYMIKRGNWTYNGKSYMDSSQSQIAYSVMKEINILKEDLGIDTNMHLLHRELYQPSLSCVLQTPISKEDSLVLSSCIIPKESLFLPQSGLLSGDCAYEKAFKENEDRIKEVFGLENLLINFIRMNDLIDPQTNQHLNLRDNSLAHEKIQTVWNHIILEMLIKKNIKTFVGRTYRYSGNKCIFFEISRESSPLKSNDNLIIIPRDLSFAPIHCGANLGIRYYDEEITVPHMPTEEDNRDKKYSFLASDVLKKHIEILSRNGNLIFYGTD